jgi:hypothetical protein
VAIAEDVCRHGDQVADAALDRKPATIGSRSGFLDLDPPGRLLASRKKCHDLRR